MPGRREVLIHGLRFKVKPGYWLRSLTHFPFFFESHNSSFIVEIYREAEDSEPWPRDKVPLQVTFSDGTKRLMPLDVPDLKVGESFSHTTEEIYVPRPGQTILGIPMATTRIYNFYSYNVRQEEALWIAFATIVVVVASLVSAVSNFW